MRSDAALAFVAALMTSAPAPARVAWLPVCDPGDLGAARPLPLDEDGPKPPAACHAPCTLAKRPKLSPRLR